MHVGDPLRLQIAANRDPEFRLAARYWNATLSLESAARALRVEIAEGEVVSCRESAPGQPATITVVAPAEGWVRSGLQPRGATGPTPGPPRPRRHHPRGRISDSRD